MLALADEAERLAAVEVAKAVVASDMVVALADAADEPLARANTCGVLAMTLAYANRFAESLAVCEAGIAIADGAGLVVEAARVRLASVHALSRLGRYDEALAAGEAARVARRGPARRPSPRAPTSASAPPTTSATNRAWRLLTTTAPALPSPPTQSPWPSSKPTAAPR